MTLIRIVNGCYAAHPNGGRLQVIDKGQTVEVPEDEAARLVSLGVAAYEKEPVLMADLPTEPIPEAAPSDTPDEEENEATDEMIPGHLIPGHLDEEELRSMPFQQLKKLAADCGLQVGKLRSRENIVKALAEMTVFVDAEDEVPPSMEAEDVVV